MAAGTQHYVHGPALVQSRTGAGPVFEHVGTSDGGVNIAIYDEWEDVPADYAGKIPADRQWMGEIALVTGVLTKYDEDVLKKLHAKPRTSGTRGTFTSTDMGSLMIAESLAYELIVKGPYSGKAFQTAKIPAGYHFKSAFLAGPDEIDKMATRFKKVHFIFYCMTLFATDFSGVLYDHDVSGAVAVT